MTSGLGTAAIIHYQLIIIIINNYDNDNNNNNNNKCFGDWGLYTKLFRFLLLIGMDSIGILVIFHLYLYVMFNMYLHALFNVYLYSCVCVCVLKIALKTMGQRM